MKILLFVTQEYERLLPPFFYLFEKYFGDNEVILVIDKPLTIKLQHRIKKFVVPGYDQEKWNFRINFGDGMLKAMNHYGESHYIVLFPDHWLYQSSNLKDLKSLIEYCKVDKNVVRGNITANKCVQSHGIFLDTYKNLNILRGNLDISSCMFEAGISFHPSIFSTYHCNELISTNWSLWQCESLGTYALKDYDGYAITTTENIVFHDHVCSQQRDRNVIIDTNKFSKNDIDEITKRVKKWRTIYS